MEYFIHLAILISIWSILSLSLNLVVGYTGLLSLTHAAFFGIGAYTTAIASTVYGLNFFLTVPLGMAITIIISCVFGLVLSRFKGDYYALISFGFNIIIFSVFLNWQSLTRGPLGIPGIDRPSISFFSSDFIFNSNLVFLLLVAIVGLAVYYLATFITQSSFGRILKAIREDETAVQVFGYKTSHYKLLIFIFSSCLASVAGAFYASYITFIEPSTFSLQESIFILAIIILGGLANNQGVFWGTVFLILLPEALRFVGFPTEIASQMRQVVYGSLLVALMLYRPKGLMGEYKL